MTRVLVVEQNHGGQLYRYLRSVYDLPGKPASFHRPGPLPLRPGDRLLVRDLLAAMLIESDNDAARALAEAFLRAGNGRPLLLPRITALSSDMDVTRGSKPICEG